MPDLLAHALLAYAVCLALSRRIPWLTPPYLTLGMVGAVLPDLAKVQLVLSSWNVRQALGIPFSWGGLHTGGGVLLTVLLGTLLVDVPRRRRVFGLLGLGAVTHLLADSLLITASGRTIPFLWPLSTYAPPTPGLYASTSPIPTVGAAFLVAVAYCYATEGVPTLGGGAGG